MMTKSGPAGSGRKPGNLLKGTALAVFIVILFLALRFFHLQQVVLDRLGWIELAGAKGPAVYFCLYLLAGVFMFPGVILTMAAGVLFGVVKGSLIVYLSSTASVTAAFLVSRYLARDFVLRKTAGNRMILLLDRAVGSEGWKIVGLTRLSPFFPYNLLNYAFGLTRVSLRDYVLASFFGMMPLSTFYVYLGSLAGSLVEMGVRDSGHSRTGVEWAVYGVGLIVTVIITVLVSRIARRALKETIQTESKPEV